MGVRLPLRLPLLLLLLLLPLLLLLLPQAQAFSTLAKLHQNAEHMGTAQRMRGGAMGVRVTMGMRRMQMNANVEANPAPPSIAASEEPGSAWSNNIARSLTEVYFEAAEALSEAIEAENKRLRVDVMTPGLHPALEKQAPGSQDLVVELVLALLPALQQHFNRTKILCMSTGDAAFTAAYVAKAELNNQEVLCREIAPGNVGQHDSCILYMTPQNSLGDEVIVQVENCVKAAPQATHIIINGKLEEKAALGISEKDRRKSFLREFKQAYYFRNLFTIRRPSLEPIERGVCIFKFGSGDWQVHAVVGEDLAGPGSLNRFSRVNYFRRSKDDPTSDSPPRFVLAARFSESHGCPNREQISDVVEKAIPRIERAVQEEFNKVTDPAKAKQILLRAATTKDIQPDTVLAAMLMLEKERRSKLEGQKRKRDLGEVPADAADLNVDTFKSLGASWRLIFTTGTAKTQKKGVAINYFPVKAVQTFDTSTMTIRNGIFLGSLPILQFSGSWEWVDRRCRLEFDFDSVAIGPFTIGLPKSSKPQKVKPAFDWIDVNSNFCVARGAGGGLALWLKEPDASSLEAPYGL